jgi:hypothetical protein
LLALPGSCSPEDAFLALHEELLAMRHERTALAAEITALQRSARAAAKTQREAERRARDADRRAREAEARARESEASAREAEARAREADARAQAAAARAELASARAEEMQARLRAEEAARAGEQGRARDAEAAAREVEEKRAALQDLVDSFKSRARQLRAELEAARKRSAGALRDLARYLELAGEPGDVGALFRFDDEEVRLMASRVMLNMIAPTEVAFLRELFCVPSDSADAQMRAMLRRRRDAALANAEGAAADGGGVLQMCHASSGLWRRVRRGLYAFWQMTAWDALRLRPSVLHAMLTVFLDYVAEYAFMGGGGGDSSSAAQPGLSDDDARRARSSAAQPGLSDDDARRARSSAAQPGLSDDDARRAMSDRLVALEAVRRRLCAEMGLGVRQSMYGDGPLPPGEGAKVVVSALVLTAHDAGSPWAPSVRAVVDHRRPDDPALAALAGDEAGHRWLEEEHGIYVFDNGTSRIYRYVHPPHELRPAASLGLTLEELYAESHEARTAAARQRVAFVGKLAQGTTASHTPCCRAEGPGAPEAAAHRAPPLGRAWMREARLLIREARHLLLDVAEREFGPVDDPAQRDAFLCRLLGQLVLVTPRLSVTDFASHYRASMQDRHHRWVMEAVRAQLSGQGEQPDGVPSKAQLKEAGSAAAAARKKRASAASADKKHILRRPQRGVRSSLRAGPEGSRSGGRPDVVAAEAPQGPKAAAAPACTAVPAYDPARPGMDEPDGPAEAKAAPAPRRDHPVMRFQMRVVEDSSSASSSDEAGSDSEGAARPAAAAFAKARFELPTVAMPATAVTVPSELRYHCARRNCRVPAALPVQRSAVALELSRQLQCRVFLSMSDEPEASQLDGFEDWALIMEAYREKDLTLPGSGGGSGGEEAAVAASAAEERTGLRGGSAGTRPEGPAEGGRASEAEPAEPEGITSEAAEPPAVPFASPWKPDEADSREVKLRRAMEPDRNGGMRNRFVFAHSRGQFVGLRVHAYVMCPRVMAPDLDLRAFAADMVHVTRIALGSMIGIQRPLSGMGQGDAAIRKVSDVFFPPRRCGQAFMMELIKALYTALHSDAILEVYA